MTASTMVTSPWSEPAVSSHDTARANAEAEQHTTERRNAVLAVASGSHSTEDARLLLDILGLGADDIRAARELKHTAAA